MQLKTLLDKIDLNIKQVDFYKQESDITSVNLMTNLIEQKPGVLYIGELSQLPNEIVSGTTFICCSSEICEIKTSGERNVFLTSDSFNTLIDRIYSTFEDSVFIISCMEKLVKISSTGFGLDALFQNIYELMQIPMCLVDTQYRLLAYNEGILNYPDFKKAVKKRVLPASRIQNINRADLKEAFLNYNDLYFMWAKSDQEYILTTLIKVDQTETAHFLAYVGNENPLKYYKLVQFICHLISLELQKTAFYQHNENILENQFMKSLIENTLSPSEKDNFLHKLGWKENIPYQILLLSGENKKIDPVSAQRILRTLSPYLAETHSLLYNGYYVILTQINNPVFFQKAPELLKQFHFIASISSEFYYFSGMTQSYGQAVNAMRYLLNGSFKGSFIRYQDCMYNIMGEELKKSCNISQFFHPGTIALYQKDCIKNTNLLETLAAYLEFNNDPDSAAAFLHIHRNTLYYRINKIQEEYNLNLSSGMERVQILLTIEFLKTQS